MSKGAASFMIAALLMGLVSLSVRADDVKITNDSDQPVKFIVIAPSIKLRDVITLQPKESLNPLKRSLWRKALVVIYALESVSEVDCAISIFEAELPYEIFYLPRVSSVPGYRACAYTSNLPNPKECDCFADHNRYDHCYNACTDVSDAHVNIIYRPGLVNVP